MATLTATQISAIQAPILAQLRTATTQAEFNSLVAQAASAGAPLNSGVVSSFQTGLTQKLAKASTSAPTTPTTTTPTAPVAPTLTAAQISAIQAPFLQQLQTATTQAQFDSAMQQAAAAGAPINSGVASSFQTSLSQKIAKANAVPTTTPTVTTPVSTAPTAAQISNLQAPILQQLQQATSQAQFDSLIKQATDLGAPINAGILSNMQTGLQQRIANAATATQAAKTADFEKQITAATTPAQVTDLVAKAQAAGVTVNPVVVDRANQAIKTTQATADFASKLGAPTGFSNVFAPNGMEFVSIAKDPVTGAEGGWYQLSGNGMQKVDASGVPTGAVIPTSDFNKLQATAQQNVAVYNKQQTAQQAALKLATDTATFESNLPKPGTPAYTNMLNNRFNMTGPDGADYQPVVGQGWVVAPKGSSSYTPVGNPTAAPISTKDIQGVFDAKAASDNAAGLAARSALIASQKDAMSDPYGKIFADLDKLVNKTVGWQTLATIAGSMVGGPLGAAVANAAGGAIKGQSLETIIKGAALTYALAYGTEALTEALTSTANTAIQQGIGDPTSLGQFASDLGDYSTTAQAIDTATGLGDLPQSVVDAANATSDPIGALSAANGWTPADPAYLESIGASQDLIDAATTAANQTGSIASEITPTPIEPTVPVSQGPVGPVAPGNVQAPFDLTSTGVSDLPEGTVIGNDVVMANGKTVALDDYLKAIDSQQPISIDGNMTTGGVPEGTVTVNQGISTPETIVGGEAPPPGYLGDIKDLSPTDLSNLTPGEVASLTPDQLSTLSPEQLANIPTGGLTTNELIALAAVGVPAAAIAVAAASAGGGSAAATVPAAVAPSAPVTTAPVTTAPVTPEPISPTTPTAPGTPTTPVQPTGPTAPGTPGTPGTPTTPGPTTPGTPTTPTTPVPPSSEVVPPGQTPTPPTVTPPTPENPVKITDYSTPYQGEYSNQSVLERFMSGTITYGDIAALVAAGLVLPSILGAISPSTQPTEQSYGPIPPTQWGSAATLVNPGQNPGWFAGNFPKPAYQTTNPYQAQFFWGQHPAVGPGQSRDIYNQTQPGAGTTAWGLQEGPGQVNTSQLLNQINQTALDPNFVGYSQYPLQGYVPPFPQPVAGPVIPTPAAITTGFVR